MLEDSIRICVSLLEEHDLSTAYLEMPKGYGNCYKCKFDPINNPKCLGYHPCTLFTTEVYDGKKD